MSCLQLAVEQITSARDYTMRLLEHVAEKVWFRQPGGLTHVAWEVGHLAVAQYRLSLERIRGRRAEDDALIDEDFLRLFARDSVPDADPARYPPPSGIRAVFDRVHRQVLLELPNLPEEELDYPVLKPHLLAKTKLQSLLWCARHEMVHAGQIGLLRRLLGYPPLW